jgi:hypothetical protein
MKVGIQNKQGWLILAWNDGKRRTMATGIRADIAGARSLAQKIATLIELDFIQRDEGRYDETLVKYKPHLLGKSATEISVPELFDRFTNYQAKSEGLSQSSIVTRYIALRKMLEKVLDWNRTRSAPPRRSSLFFKNIAWYKLSLIFLLSRSPKTAYKIHELNFNLIHPLIGNYRMTFCRQ